MLAKRSILLEDLKSHALITGVTGFGKTTLMLDICIQLLKLGIPFIALECVKTEYRVLKMLKRHPDETVRKLVDLLEVYTVGDEAVSPATINIFEREVGTDLDQHIGHVQDILETCLALGAPFNEILFEAIERTLYAFPDPDFPPTLRDLLASVRHIIKRRDYCGDLEENLAGALVTRLNTLMKGVPGRIFQSQHSVPSIEHLVARQSILELDKLRPTDKALYGHTVLNSARECLSKSPWNGTDTRIMILVEEGHLLAGSEGQATPSDVMADPEGSSTKTIRRMCQEFRQLGGGLLISTQYPSALSSGVAKAVGTHIAFRQREGHERDIISDAMGLTPLQREHLGQLGKGEFYMVTPNQALPTLVQGINTGEVYGL